MQEDALAAIVSLRRDRDTSKSDMGIDNDDDDDHDDDGDDKEDAKTAPPAERASCATSRGSAAATSRSTMPRLSENEDWEFESCRC